METKILKKKVLHPHLSYAVNGILFQAHKELGRYCNEQQYCDRIEQLLAEKKIQYEREKVLPESFEGEHGSRHKIDFLVEERIILEIKAKRFVTKDDYYQTRRYLQAAKKKLALLVNMRDFSVNPKRVLNSDISSTEKDYNS